MRGICPAVAPSSVTCGDSFPQRGKPYRRLTRFIHYTIRSRAGDPAPPKKPSPKGGRWRGTRRMRGICPGVAPSSVTYGDSFPQRGKPYRRFTRAFGVTVKSRAGHAPPLRGGGFVYSNVGRGDPAEKPSPLGGKVARNTPDEGNIFGSCNKPTRSIATAARRQGVVAAPAGAFRSATAAQRRLLARR